MNGYAMKKPIKEPPQWHKIMAENPQVVAQALASPDVINFIRYANTNYLYWDKFKPIFLQKHNNLNIKAEIAWTCLKVSRISYQKLVPLNDTEDLPFSYWVPDRIQEHLHFIDRNASGLIQSSDPEAHRIDKEKYIVSALMEEAISSSQLEGAATTRKDAKSMLRQGRKPKDKSEMMIYNNYNALMSVKKYKYEKLSREVIASLHQTLTQETLDPEFTPGEFRTSDDIKVYSQYGEVLHVPPVAKELDARIEALCAFANATPASYMHPVIKAVILHFWLAYVHPFPDGNGRTARALFYWFMLKSGYWMTEYISISSILNRAPAQYMKSYLYAETDGNDLTYFLVYNLKVIRESIDSIVKYIEKKARQLAEAKIQLARISGLNDRQTSLLSHGIKHESRLYTIHEHMKINQTTYETARKDFIGLVKREFFIQMKMGKKFVYQPRADLSTRLELSKKIPER